MNSFFLGGEEVLFEGHCLATSLESVFDSMSIKQFSQNTRHSGVVVEDLG